MGEYGKNRFSKKKNNVDLHDAEVLGKDAVNRELVWLNEVNGYKIRPGLYSMYGATMLAEGIVNFTVYSNGATSITLNFYHRGDDKPFTELPFPEEYKIGKVYSMIVFDLDIEDLEYNYSVDGPWEPEKGLLLINLINSSIRLPKRYRAKEYGERPLMHRAITEPEL